MFQGIDFAQVSFFLFLKRHDWLADHFVECGPAESRRSKAEIVALIQSRLRPIIRDRSKCL